MSTVEPLRRERKSHIWARDKHDFYVEPEWCSARLFQIETFTGTVWDPACGMGRILASANAAGLTAMGTDVVQRGGAGHLIDFLNGGQWSRTPNIVTNPPFDVARRFAEQAIAVTSRKVAILFPTARLNAARWLQDLPFARVWLLTPRPSMPPGEAILRGEKPVGGKMDFCWLVFDHAHPGPAGIGWLHRDGTP